jgi:hypothetical protein
MSRASLNPRAKIAISIFRFYHAIAAENSRVAQNKTAGETPAA